MAATTGDTMAEGLKKMLGQLGALMSLPDADANFLSGIQNEIAGYLRSGAMAAQGGELQLPPGPGAPGPANATDHGGMGGMMGGMGGPPPDMGGGGGMGPGGDMNMPPGGGMGIQPPNPDELSRMLATAGG